MTPPMLDFGLAKLGPTGVADGYRLWCERYDRHVRDMFDIEDEIAE